MAGGGVEKTTKTTCVLWQWTEVDARFEIVGVGLFGGKRGN